MTRISDSNREHFHLSEFVRESRHEISGGEDRPRYMKPLSTVSLAYDRGIKELKD